MKNGIKVNAIKCPRCGDVIYSRAVHDFHHCSCGAINIDGGFDYCIFGWIPSIRRPISIQLTIPNVSVEELYRDWNHQFNCYGKIKGGRKFWFVYLRRLKK
jgi:hypothetical protein